VVRQFYLVVPLATATIGLSSSCLPETSCLEKQTCTTEPAEHMGGNGHSSETAGGSSGPSGNRTTGGASGDGSDESGGVSGTLAAGNDGESGDSGGVGGANDAPDPTEIGVIGTPCDEERELRCEGPASDRVLACEDAAWVVAERCERGERCDSRRPACVSIAPGCARLAPGTSFCEGTTRHVCGPDLVTDSVVACEGKCVNGECTPPRCGDGTVQPPEECDDGNDSDRDDCPMTCKKARCGDGITWEGHEECDDSNALDDDECLSTCLSATCGDGFVRADQEECDDKNTVDTDGCLKDCLKATCGDGFVWTDQEECDDRNTADGDGCSSNCVAEPIVSENECPSTLPTGGDSCAVENMDCTYDDELCVCVDTSASTRTWVCMPLYECTKNAYNQSCPTDGWATEDFGQCEIVPCEDDAECCSLLACDDLTRRCDLQQSESFRCISGMCRRGPSNTCGALARFVPVEGTCEEPCPAERPTDGEHCMPNGQSCGFGLYDCACARDTGWVCSRR
jgi:cysteine-rich repeat protein